MSNKIFFADPGTTSTLISYLTSNISSAQTEITLNNATNFPSVGIIQIESEIIKYTSKTSNTLTDCIRGSNNTSSASHFVDTIVTLLPRDSEGPLSTDQVRPGWYKERGNSNLTLRLSDSNLMMKGTVRFNQDINTFQGYNGSEWVTFNAEKGDQGDPGQSASNQFDFINVPEGASGINTLGRVFRNKTVDNINLRTLASGTFDINPIMTGLNAMTIDDNDLTSDYITLTPNPRPYVWDFSTPQQANITYLKSNLNDAKLKAFGQISKWLVKNTVTIYAGTAVRVTLSTSQSNPTYDPSTVNLVIEPFTYTEFVQENKAGCGFLGIALQTVTGNGTATCEVCTEGITTVKIGDLTTSFPYGISLSNTLNGPGAYGFVGSNAEIYNVSQSSGFISNLSVAGYWLERGVFNYGQGVLFYVKGNFVFS